MKLSDYAEALRNPIGSDVSDVRLAWSDRPTISILELFIDMEQLNTADINRLFYGTFFFGKWEGAGEISEDWPPAEHENAFHKIEVRLPFPRELGAFCKKYGMESTLAQLDRIEKTLLKSGDNLVEIRTKEHFGMVVEARRRFYDELNACVLLHLDKKWLWVNPTDGWEPIIKVLDDPRSSKLANSSAEEQIVEASKCLALDRGTACVMHLQNVLELGLIRLRRKLPNRYLPSGKKNELDDWIAAIDHYVQSTPTPSDAAQMRSIAACCSAVRVAWRHPVVHASMIFRETIALEVYNAMKALMREIIAL